MKHKLDPNNPGGMRAPTWALPIPRSISMFHFHCLHFVIYHLIRFKFALNPFENFSELGKFK
jgi:hypothetical protein